MGVMAGGIAGNPVSRRSLGMCGGSAMVIALLSTLGTAGWARAETAAAAPTASTVEEVIVTAEKRSSTVQNTPISITAITGAQLQAQGVAGLYGVITSTPGLSIRSAGPGQTELEMRGLSSGGGSAPTVGFYLDETPLSPPAAALNGKVVIDPDLFDLNRVEVLRGPQGTLYGSGSMGGTVRLITNQPDLEKFSAEIAADGSGTHGGGANGGVDAMVNAPLVTDKAALRVVFTDKYRSGWIDRDVIDDFPLESGSCAGWFGYGCVRGNLNNATVNQVNKDVNTEHLYSIRGSLLLKPTDKFTVTLTGMYQSLNMGGYDTFDIPYGDGNQLTHYEAYPMAEPMSDEFKLGSLTMKYEAPWFDITSATSYWQRSESQTIDDTETVQNLTASSSFIPIGYTEIDGSKQFSQELRFSSRGEGRLQWVAGAFYSDLTSVYYTLNQATAYAPISVGGAAANPEGIIFNADNPYHMKQYAVFGDATFAITPTLRLKAGLRYFRYDTDFSYFENGWGTQSGNATPTTGALTNSAQGVTPSFNLSYRPDSNLTVYATASKGFRPGGVNLPAPVSLCGAQPLTYQPDSVWNYELGEKARLFGGAVVVNSDFYYIRWNNIQQLISPPCDYPYTTNAGTAASYGPEIEFTARLGYGFTLTGNGTYTDAKLTSVQPGSGLYVGERVLNIPVDTMSWSLNYRRQVWEGADLVARVSDDYVGNSVDVAFYRETLPSYNIVKARLGVDRERWSAYAYVDNLLDKRAIISINNTSFSWLDPAFNRASTNQPRTIGVSFDYKFQ